MEPNRRVVLFVLISTFVLFVVSVVSILTGFSWTPISRVNLVSDILTTEPLVASTTVHDTTVQQPAGNVVASRNFNLYSKGNLITDFHSDTSSAALTAFVKKLHDLKIRKQGKIRIAYFGDSMIEGDLLTQTVRALLQKQFGGNGVGFIPIHSPVAGFRQTASSSCSDNWTDDNFKGKNSRLYLSGHTYYSANGWFTMNDRTANDSSVVLEKALLCGKAAGNVAVTVNNKTVRFNAPNDVNRIVVESGNGTSLQLSSANEKLPIYGVSFESANGVYLDNFSFRGITGVEFAKIDSAFLSAIAINNPYDLIIFQYGVNLMFRPNEKNFSWYAKTMLPILKKIRACFPNTDFLLVSTADRAFRYGGKYASAVGIDSLVKVQANLAFNTGSAFYNQFATMGGTNSIVDWATRKPSLANQDYVHPNHRGAEVLGNLFYEALMREYNKYEQSLR